MLVLIVSTVLFIVAIVHIVKQYREDKGTKY